MLKDGGRFLCLTPNRRFIWYRWIAPWLKINTHHLSSDEFISREFIRSALSDPGLRCEKIKYWTFIPKGDMPSSAGKLLQWLDQAGRLFRISCFRGGILFSAVKPIS